EPAHCRSVQCAEPVDSIHAVRPDSEILQMISVASHPAIDSARNREMYRLSFRFQTTQCGNNVFQTTRGANRPGCEHEPSLLGNIVRPKRLVPSRLSLVHTVMNHGHLFGGDSPLLGHEVADELGNRNYAVASDAAAIGNAPANQVPRDFHGVTR